MQTNDQREKKEVCQEKVNLDDLPIEVMYKYLLRDYKRSKVYIGQLLAEIDELRYELKNAKKVEQKVISLKEIPKAERKQMLFEYYQRMGIGCGKKSQKVKIENLEKELIALRKKMEEKENG